MYVHRLQNGSWQTFSLLHRLYQTPRRCHSIGPISISQPRTGAQIKEVPLKYNPNGRVKCIDFKTAYIFLAASLVPDTPAKRCHHCKSRACTAQLRKKMVSQLIMHSVVFGGKSGIFYFAYTKGQDTLSSLVHVHPPPQHPKHTHMGFLKSWIRLQHACVVEFEKGIYPQRIRDLFTK